MGFYSAIKCFVWIIAYYVMFFSFLGSFTQIGVYPSVHISPWIMGRLFIRVRIVPSILILYLSKDRFIWNGVILLEFFFSILKIWVMCDVIMIRLIKKEMRRSGKGDLPNKRWIIEVFQWRHTWHFPLSLLKVISNVFLWTLVGRCLPGRERTFGCSLH